MTTLQIQPFSHQFRDAFKNVSPQVRVTNFLFEFCEYELWQSKFKSWQVHWKLQCMFISHIKNTRIVQKMINLNSCWIFQHVTSTHQTFTAKVHVKKNASISSLSLCASASCRRRSFPETLQFCVMTLESAEICAFRVCMPSVLMGYGGGAYIICSSSIAYVFRCAGA
jgi:hypothetical protein